MLDGDAPDKIILPTRSETRPEALPHILNGHQQTIAEAEIWKIAIVDQRSLLGECMVSGLRPLDNMNRYFLFANMGVFLRNHVKDDKTVVLLYRSDERSSGSPERDIVRLREADPAVRVVLIADHEDLRQCVEALQMGAHGIIPMSFPLRVFVEALRVVKAGGLFVPASSMQALATGGSSPKFAPSQNDLMGFSPRQISVAKALRKGTPNKIIAYELNMCESTVKVHVRQIMKKLKAKNRTEVAYLTSRMFSNEI